MFLELRILLVLFCFSVFVFMSSLIPTSWFIYVDLDKSRVTTDSQVVFYREPLWHNITMNYHEEVVTPDNKTCKAPKDTATYENTVGSVIYKLAPSLRACVREGSTYRVTRQYLYFRPYTTEMLVENVG